MHTIFSLSQKKPVVQQLSSLSGLHSFWRGKSKGNLIYWAKPWASISDVGGLGKRGDGIEEGFGRFGDMEACKVDLCLAESEFCWVEDNSILRAIGDVINSVPEAFFDAIIP